MRELLTRRAMHTNSVSIRLWRPLAVRVKVEEVRRRYPGIESGIRRFRDVCAEGVIVEVDLAGAWDVQRGS